MARNTSLPFSNVLEIRFSISKAIAGFLAVACFVFAHDQIVVAQESSSSQVREHPLIKPIQYARAAQKRVQELDDYEAVFTKREAIDRRLVTSQMRVKIRHEPFSVYMNFIQPNSGRQVWYVDGRNNGKLHVKLTGIQSLVGPLDLSPDDPKVMQDNRHPITSMGMDRTVAEVIKQWELESKYGEIDVKYYREAKIKAPSGDIECRVIQSTHPRPRRQFKYQKTRLYLAKSNNLPIRIEQFAFPAREGDESPLVEQYTYSKIKTNRGFTSSDFSY